MEIVNITGADNIDSTSSTTTAATNVTGVAATDVIVISAPQPIGEVQTIDFKDLKVTTAGGGIVVGGIAVALEDGDTADEIASAVKAALTAKIGTASTTMEDVVSVSAKGSVVTVQFNYKDGTNVTATSLYNPNALTVANDSTTAPTYVATQNTTAISGVAVSSVAGNLQKVPVTVTINGVKHSAGTVDLTGGDGTTAGTNNYFSATGTTVAAAEKAAANAAADLVVTALNKIVGGTAVAARTAEVGELSLTAKAIGTSLPEVSVSQVDTVLSTAETTTTDSEVVVGVAAESTTGAEAQALTVSIGTLEASDKFSVYIDGLLVGEYTNASTSSPANTLAGIVSIVNGTLGTGVAVVSSTASAGGAIVITAPKAGVELPAISIAGTDASATNALVVTQSTTRDNIVAATAKTTTTSSNASISASKFAGAEQVWLKGDSNTTNLTVTTQTAGLDGVTGLANKITFGASGALAVKSSAGTVDIAGAASGLAISGSGTATGGLVLTNTTAATTAAAVKAISVDTTGATSLDVSALSNLTSVTSTGAGGVTVNPKALATKLASITSGAGADTVRINTATILDNTLTAADETVNAAVGTGAGNDTIRVNTSGAGTTTVNSGEGNDTVRLTAVSTGVATVETGAGNDTVYLDLAIGGSPKLTVDAGDGTDTLAIAGGTLTAVDYLRLNTALSGFETVKFITNGSGTIDASLLDVGALSGFTFTAGNVSQNVISKVSGQKLTLTDAAAVTTATDFTPSSSASSASGLKATALGYKIGASVVPTTYGEALDVAVSGNSSVALTLAGSAATVAVSATGASTNAKSIAPTVTLGGAASDLQSLTVNLTSARGTSTNAENEYMATFDAGTLADTGDTTWNQHLEALSSLKVNGAGVFTINNTGSDAITRVSLTNIDVSGMEAFSNLAKDGTLADNVNRSTTSITLNDLVSEVVNLGGAKDTVVTGSTVPAVDVIVGFQLSASATSATTVDTDRSDVLNVPGTLSFVKFETEATTLAAALTEAGVYEATAGTASDNVVFNFGGDTYVYVDRASGGTYTAVAGLDDGDYVVKLIGTYDVDLLVGVVS